MRPTSNKDALMWLVLCLALSMGEASMMHSSDCMKNPFASGCRGISAKRSGPQTIVGGRSLAWPLGGQSATRQAELDGGELAAGAQLPALSVANLAHRQQQLADTLQLLGGLSARLVQELGLRPEVGSRWPDWPLALSASERAPRPADDSSF